MCSGRLTASSPSMGGVRGRSGDLCQFGHVEKTITAQQRLELPFVRIRLESIQPPKPFQAEYEGSIPFTRSSLFNNLTRGSDFISDARFPIDCFTCLLIGHRIPSTALDRLRCELIKTEHIDLEKRY